MDTVTQPRDVFQRVNELDAATVQRLVDRMETRRRDPTFAAWRDAYLDRLDLTGTVLEVGCGSGSVARAIAARPAGAGSARAGSAGAGSAGAGSAGGRIVATDYSSALVAAARRLAGAEGLAGRIEFAVQDSQALSLPDGSADVVIAHTLISHLPDPRRGLAELARVVRPGGTVAIFDGDYGSLAFGGGAAGPLAAGVIERALVASMAANPTVLRTLPQLAASVGLTLIDATAHVLAEIGTGGFFVNFAETYTPMAAGAGLVPGPAASSWLDGQRRAGAEGTFFASCNYYTYLLRRHQGQHNCS